MVHQLQRRAYGAYSRVLVETRTHELSLIHEGVMCVRALGSIDPLPFLLV